MAVKLTTSDLPALMAALRTDFPASLNIYHFARNIVMQKYAWPGLEFFVDNFPDVGACICRTASTAQTGIPPLINGYAAFPYAKCPGKLTWLINQEGVVDWSEKISFCMVREPDDARAIKKVCTEHGGTAQITPGSNLYDHGVIVHFDLINIPQKCTLPEEFHLGPLSVQHAEQLTRDKSFGDSRKNLQFFRYILQAGYPSVGVFTRDDQLVAYIMQRPENKIGVGFVAVEYRSRGLFKVVLREILTRMHDDGEMEAYADASVDNGSSLGAMTRLGGTLYDGQFEWFEYIPAEVS